MKRDWKKSWLLGCAQGIRQSLVQARSDFNLTVVQTSTGAKITGSALAIRRDEETADFIKKMFGHVHQGKARVNDLHVTAVRSGLEAGQRMGSTEGKPRLTAN